MSRFAILSTMASRTRRRPVADRRLRSAAVAAVAAVAATATAAVLGIGLGTAWAAGPERSATGVGTTTGMGVQFQAFWSNYTDAERIAVLDRLKAAGVKSVRIDISWAMLQPHGPGSYDAWGVSFADRIVAMANQRGIRPLMTLWLTPAWANQSRGARALPTNVADYARAAQWAAARWRGKVVGWEIWNEQNNNRFMATADPAAYVRLLRAAYPVIHAADPSTTVVFGGLEYNDDTWLTRAYAAGAHGYFDAIGTHPYMGVADSTPNKADDGTKWTLMHAAAVHRLMVSKGDGAKSIWFTEMGWSTHPNAAATPNWLRGVSETTQATYLTETARLIHSQLPYVTRLYWYTEKDTTTGDIQYNNYGLLRQDLTPKPALYALAAVNAAAPASID